MGRNSEFKRDSILVSDKGLEKPDPTKYNLDETYGTVAVRCVFPANVYRTGQVTGKQYYWAGAGSVLSVDERDVEQLLSLIYGTSACCGGSGNSFHFFEKV